MVPPVNMETKTNNKTRVRKLDKLRRLEIRPPSGKQYLNKIFFRINCLANLEALFSEGTRCNTVEDYL